MEIGTKGSAAEFDPASWRAPDIADSASIPKGDMPGDRICIDEGHVAIAKAIFPRLMMLSAPILEAGRRIVVAVHGGSGAGKSEIGSLLGYYLSDLGIGAYILSGDNYPRRIPKDNDRERLLAFREGGIKGLVAAGGFTKERNALLRRLQAEGRDADKALLCSHPWLAAYQETGRRGLERYLGTPMEIDFEEVNKIIADFKRGAKSQTLKRMGREETELWYDEVDMSEVRALIIEWTHGNSAYLSGIDVPILLFSTPGETLEHRRSRNRDGAVDSPFTAMVLEIEQRMLSDRAANAALIVSKNGEIIRHECVRESQAAGREEAR